jgi:alpha-galactosidase
MLMAISSAVGPVPEELAQKDEWVRRNLLAGKGGLPFSFTYDGKTSAELLPSWECKVATSHLDETRTEHVLTWTDANTGLEVRCRAIEYRDFPTVEWTLHFRNPGKKETPIIENIQALDVVFKRRMKEEFYLLHHHNGDNCTPTSYQPHTTRLELFANRGFASSGGRPINGEFPCFNIEFDGGGVIAAIGWPGQWAARFANEDLGILRVTGGQELTRLKLSPGETIRTPLIVLQFWKGNYIRSQNLWRRWMVAHNMPRPGGRLPGPIAAVCMGLYQNEADEIRHIDAHLNGGIKLDYWWMDAGWYDCKEWPQVGTWEPDPVRFPKGMKPLADYLHSKGLKMILWFEPERVYPGTWLHETHPEWLLSEHGKTDQPPDREESVGSDATPEARMKISKHLNLGDPGALAWLIQHIDGFIREQGVDLFRLDYNINPLAYWRNNDPPDRKGITENFYVQGFLAFLDEIRRRHPDMLIDNCASGGRRNDLETLRRAVPLLRSDAQALNGTLQERGYSREAVVTGNQGHTYGLSPWLPFFGTGEYYNDRYAFRSHMCPSMGSASDPGKPVNWTAFRKTMEQWRAAAPNFYGDYYPLTPYSLADDAWMAWQFDRPEACEGMIQAFRREKCAAATMRFKLHGLDPSATYELTDFDKKGTTKATGRELMGNGLPIRLARRGSAVILYGKALMPARSLPKVHPVQ